MQYTHGTVVLINGDSSKDIVNQASESFDLAIHDPPFTWDAKDSIPWLKHYERILKDGGNLVTVNYPITNMDIKELLGKHSKLTIKDSITVKQGVAYKTLRGLPRHTMSLNVFYKGAITNRKYYANSTLKSQFLFEPKKAGYLSDFMEYKEHYPCRRGTNNVVLHNGAMAKWLVANILHCFTLPGDSIYDSFGGAGTFSAICNLNGRYCRSIELDRDHFALMKHEVESKNKYRTYKLTKAFIAAAEKANESKSKTTDRMERSILRCSANSQKTTKV